VELFTKRRRSVNCRSGDGYVASEVSDYDRTSVYSRLEALRSHEASHGRDSIPPLGPEPLRAFVRVDFAILALFC